MNSLSKSKFVGSLLGLAVGDAIGTTVETMPRGSFEQVNDMVGGGKYRLLPGQFTDDTTMALCIAESILETGTFDAVSIMQKFLAFYRDGHLCSNGQCFDIGKTTLMAVLRFEKNGDPMAGSTNAQAAGNGSLMRLSPIPLFFCNNPERCIELSGESSRLTHAAPAAIDCCRYYALLVMLALSEMQQPQPQENDKHHDSKADESTTSSSLPIESLRERLFSPYPSLGVAASDVSSVSSEYWQQHPLCEEVDRVVQGSYKNKTADEISPSGFSVDSLEAALWALYHSNSFEEGLLQLVNLGQDSDTSAAIYGMLAGALYGADAIREEWRQQVSFGGLIELMASELHDRAPEVGSAQAKAPASENYITNKAIYDMLEEDYRGILRKLLPGPRRYKELAHFQADRDLMKARFDERLSQIAEENVTAIAVANSTWIEFGRRLAVDEETVKQYLGVNRR